MTSEKLEAERQAAIRADRELFDSLGIPGEKGRREGLAEAVRQRRPKAKEGRRSLWHVPEPWEPAFPRKASSAERRDEEDEGKAVTAAMLGLYGAAAHSGK